MSLLLILSMILILLSGCNGDDVSGSLDNNTSFESDINSEISEPRSTLFVGYCDPVLALNPFAVSSEGNDVVEMTSVRLLTLDRNGKLVNKSIEGEISEFDGRTCKYKGISNVEIKNVENEQTELVIKLRDEIKCSDGYNISIDDVIFTMYVLSDPKYNGPQEFSKLPVVGLEEYKNGDAENISGITRIDDNTLSVKLENFDEGYISKLNLFVAPICHYGDVAMFEYEDNSFGFEKGNIQSILSNNIPYGGGPYSFVSNEEKTIKLKRNLWFYKGIPNVEFVQLEYCEAAEMLSQVSNGNLDVVELPLDDDLYQEIISINGAEDGSIFNTSIFTDESHGGLNRIALVVNASAVDSLSYSCEYTKDYSWINEIHLMETNPGF